MKFLLMIFAVMAVITSLASACDFDWQYIGHVGLMCAIEDPLDSAVVRGGKYRAWDDPLGGGVYVHHDPDTIWTYGGLISHRVFALRSFPYFRPGRLFASTDQGLYLFEGDTTWTLLNTVGIGGEGEQVDFVVSPYDTNLWVIRVRRWGEQGLLFHVMADKRGRSIRVAGIRCSPAMTQTFCITPRAISSERIFPRRHVSAPLQLH